MKRIIDCICIFFLTSQIVTAQQLPYATTGTINGHEWVDLCLSVKWATCNVGASSPEENGDYFAWGETSTKNDYSWSTLKYCTGHYFSKYVPSWLGGYWSGDGRPDDRERLALSDDAARANWGGSWRMPTAEEWEELLNKCTWTWTTRDGKNGYEVVSKINGNSIFLPAAGGRSDTGLYFVDYFGYYWSSSLCTANPGSAWRVFFYSGNVRRFIYGRHFGHSVRPVSAF